MIWIDYIIITVVSFSVLVSLIRGFIRDTLSCVTWGSAFFVTSYYYAYLTGWFTYFNNKLVRNGLAIILLFFTTLIIGTIVNNVISSLVEKTSLSGTNRVLGVCFGALRGGLIVAVIIYVLDKFTSLSKSPEWQHSQLIPQFSYIINWILDYLKSTSNFYLGDTIGSLDNNEGMTICAVLLVSSVLCQ